MFLCQGHVHVLEVWPCFKLWDTFLYQSHVSVSMFLYQVLVFILSPFFKSKKCFSSLFLVYIKVYFLFLKLYVYVCLCFINSIHSKDIYPKLTSCFCRFLRFMSSTFNMCHIFIGFTFSMFCILGQFLRFFLFSFL